MTKFARLIATNDQNANELCVWGGYQGGLTEAAQDINADTGMNLEDVTCLGIATEEQNHLNSDESLIHTGTAKVAFLYFGRWFVKEIDIYLNGISYFLYASFDSLMAVGEHPDYDLDEESDLLTALGQID